MFYFSFECDQIYRNHGYEFGSHFVELLKSDLVVQQIHFSLLDKSSSLAAALSVTKLITINVKNLSILC
jgi:hypothetical protein